MLNLTINKFVKKVSIADKEILRAGALIDDNFIKNEKKIFELELNIVGEKEIKKINSVYRKKNSITDVLSFAWGEEKMIKTDCLGQVYICYPQIKRQAKEYKITIKEEFFRMFFHSVLHILGFDHMKEGQAKKMFKKQEELLKVFLVG